MVSDISESDRGEIIDPSSDESDLDHPNIVPNVDDAPSPGTSGTYIRRCLPYF